MSRQRSRWSQKEDAVLEAAVRRSSQSTSVDWHDIAAFVPGRSSSDCLKRWQQKLSSKMNTGTWSSIEDSRLRDAVSKHGTRWVVVAGEVGTRNGEQCAKRWTENLNPSLDHGPWSTEEDELLLSQVDTNGKNWKLIADTAFDSRAPLALKNRYSLLMRRAERETAHQSLSAPTSGSSTPQVTSHPHAAGLGPTLVTPEDSRAGTPTKYQPTAFDSSYTHSNVASIFTDFGSAYNSIPLGLGLSNESHFPMDIDTARSGSGYNSGFNSTMNSPRHSMTEWDGRMNWIDPSFVDFQSTEADTAVPSGSVSASSKGTDNPSEFSVTCQRGKLKSLMHHIVDIAAPQEAGTSAEDEVTLTLRFKH